MTIRKETRDAVHSHMLQMALLPNKLAIVVAGGFSFYSTLGTDLPRIVSVGTAFLVGVAVSYGANFAHAAGAYVFGRLADNNRGTDFYSVMMDAHVEPIARHINRKPGVKLDVAQLRRERQILISNSYMTGRFRVHAAITFGSVVGALTGGVGTYKYVNPYFQDVATRIFINQIQHVTNDNRPTKWIIRNSPPITATRT